MENKYSSDSWTKEDIDNFKKLYSSDEIKESINKSVEENSSIIETIRNMSVIDISRLIEPFNI